MRAFLALAVLWMAMPVSAEPEREVAALRILVDEVGSFTLSHWRSGVAHRLTATTHGCAVPFHARWWVGRAHRLIGT